MPGSLWYGRPSITMPMRSSASSFFRISRPWARMTLFSKSCWACKPASTARAFSSQERPRISTNCSYICLASSAGLPGFTKVSRKMRLFSLKISPSLVKAAFTASGVVATVGQERCDCACFMSLGRSSIMGQKMMSSGFFLWCTAQHVVHVRDAHFGGEAGIDGPALGAFLVKLLVGVVGVNQVLGGNPQRLKVGAENRDSPCTC